MGRPRKSTVGAAVNVDVAPAEPVLTRAKREAGTDKPRGVVDDFGTRPAGVTHWRCYRVSDDGTRAQDPLEHESSATEMGVSRFPIAELASSVIRKRWGGGRYSVEFLGPRPGKGTCIHLSWGQKVTIGDRARRAQSQPEAVPVAAAPVAPPVDPIEMWNQMKQAAREENAYIASRVNADMTGLAQLAAVLAGNNQAAQQLSALHQNAQLAQALVALNARLDRIEAGAAAEDDDEEDDEEDDDEYEDDDEDDDEEPDTITKMVQFFDKHGPMIKMGLEYFAQNPGAVPASLNGANGASPPSESQPVSPQTAT